MGSSPVSTVGLIQPGKTWKDAWEEVQSQHAHEYGVSYSGSFGSKHGATLVHHAPDTDAAKAALEQIEDLIYQHEMKAEGNEDPEPEMKTCVDETGTYARTSCGGTGKVPMTVIVRQPAGDPVMEASREGEDPLVPKLQPGEAIHAVIKRDCRICGGLGKVPRSDAELQTIRKAKADRRAAYVALNLTDMTMTRLAAVYDDKWGPVAVVVAGDRVWMGGYCSS